MAKIVVQHDTDLSIGITLERSPHPDRVAGWQGKCTECGWPMHRWNQDNAIRAAQRHVDAHEAVVIGSH